MKTNYKTRMNEGKRDNLQNIITSQRHNKTTLGHNKVCPRVVEIQLLFASVHYFSNLIRSVL